MDVRYRGNGWGNNELEYYTNRAQNAQIKGGNLVITAQKEIYTGSDGVTRNYTSARMKTQGFSARPTAASKRASRFPRGRECGPLSGCSATISPQMAGRSAAKSTTWKISARRPGIVHGSLHGPSTTGPLSDATAPCNLSAGQNFADDFHLYAVEWQPGTVRFCVNSDLYTKFNSSQWPPGGTWVFDHPFFIILNVAVGGDWPGSPDNTTVFPQQMPVDFVRVYAKQ